MEGVGNFPLLELGERENTNTKGKPRVRKAWSTLGKGEGEKSAHLEKKRWDNGRKPPPAGRSTK